MGLFPLQKGKVRIFIKDSQGSEAFLGEDIAKMTPLKGKMKLFLGQARDVVCNRIIEKNKRYTVRGNLHNQELIIRYEIENFKDKAVKLQIVEQVNRLARQYFGRTRGDVEWKLGPKTSKQITLQTKVGSYPVLQVQLPARPKAKDKTVKKQIIKLHIVLKNLW